MNIGNFDRPEALIIVAGASCVGKSTFLRKIRGGDYGKLPADIVNSDISEYHFYDARDLIGCEKIPNKIILHYDIFRPITFYGVSDYKTDPVLSLVERAAETSILTLWDDPALLADRARARRRNLWRKMLRRPFFEDLSGRIEEFVGARRRRAVMQPWFDNPTCFCELYERWWEFCRGAQVTAHWIGRPSEGFAFRPFAPDDDMRALLEAR